MKSLYRMLEARPVWGVCLLIVTSIVPSSSACTYEYNPKEVDPDFVVGITDHGKGVANLHVEVEESRFSTEKSTLALEAITDEHGMASFHVPHPGAFTISIKNIELAPPEDIIVKGTTSKGALPNIAIQLPENDILIVRSISGSIHGQVRTADPVNYEALVDFGPRVKLTLISARSEEIVESHMANDSGGFSFSALPQGLYFLHLEAQPEPAAHRRALSEYIPIAIDPLAKMPNLDLYMSPGTCVDFSYRNGDAT